MLEGGSSGSGGGRAILALAGMHTLSARRPRCCLRAAAVLTAAGTLAAAALPAAGAGATPPGGRHGVETAGNAASVSTNWAGYAVTSPGTTYTSVTATWRQPAVTCNPAGGNSGSAFWVGLGGYNTDSQALEQVGADSDCNGGHPTYFAWYELVPSAAVNLRLKIFPGNTVTASVNAIDGGSTIEVQLINRTRGTRVTSLVPTIAPDLSSAEWITEAPAECNTKGSCSAQPLANFGSVSFTRVAALGNGIGGTVADPVWSADAIELQPAPAHGGAAGAYGAETPSGSTAGASPQPPSVDGRAFTITWNADATAGAGAGSGMASSPGSTWARPRSADPEAAAG